MHHRSSGLVTVQRFGPCEDISCSGTLSLRDSVVKQRPLAMRIGADERVAADSFPTRTISG